jgi:vanillate monooxygenase ferredoxin subunit
VVKISRQQIRAYVIVQFSGTTSDRVEISPPRNNFALDSKAREVILLAGGIGITPLLSMATHLETGSTQYQLHYFTRSPETTAFHSLIENGPIAAGTTFYFGLGAAAVAEKLGDILKPYRSGAHLYICGPGPFIEAVLAASQDLWPKEAIHLEYFSAESPQLEEGGDTFEVYLEQQGKSITIPSHMSITDVLGENGIEVEMSCEQGICGTCLTKVLDGVPDHQDQFLSEEEQAQNDQMLICVSRCRGKRLVLDI